MSKLGIFQFQKKEKKLHSWQYGYTLVILTCIVQGTVYNSVFTLLNFTTCKCVAIR